MNKKTKVILVSVIIFNITIITLTIIVLICLQSPTYDANTFITMKESSERIMDDLSEDDKEQFKMDLTTIIFSSEKDFTDIHGKTYTEIHKIAENIREDRRKEKYLLEKERQDNVNNISLSDICVESKLKYRDVYGTSFYTDVVTITYENLDNIKTVESIKFTVSLRKEGRDVPIYKENVHLTFPEGLVSNEKLTISKQLYSWKDEYYNKKDYFVEVVKEDVLFLGNKNKILP